MTSSIMPVLVDAGALREKIYDKATKALGEAFKLDLKGRTLGVEDITISRREFSPEEQKRALLRGDSLRVPAKGTLVLRDGEGKVIDKAEGFTLVHLPYLTERHTVIADGNEYQFANQLRRKPGVYTQRGENGEIKTVFNLGRGANFDLGFNAEKGTFAVQYGTSNVPLYPMLRGLGVPHAEIASALGPSLASANAVAQGHQVETAINKLYEKLVPVTMRVPGANTEAKAEAIRKRYAVTTLDPEVTTHTLGYGHSTVTPHALLDAAKKLVAVHKGNVDVDDTDSLSFKTFHAVDDFLAERIRLGAREWSPKAKRALNGKSDIRAALHPAPLTPTINKFVTTSSLTAVPSGINPMELIDHAVKVTALGEGGIPSDRAIPFAARMTHSTHFGAIDPVRTPECHSADTEVLTSTGWKLWPAVTETDLLACRVEGRLAFCRPERLIREPYKGVMYGLTTEKLSYLVTPNHRIWCNTVDALYDQTDKNKGWRFAEASAVHGKPRVFDTGHAAMEGTPTDTFTLPEVTGANNVKNVGPISMEDWASLVGWYLSEGSVSRREGGRLAGVKISQVASANPWKCQIIEALLSRLPFTWSQSGNQRDYEIYGKQIAAYFEPFGFCDTKYIPEYFFHVGERARENLLEALLLGDGRINSRRKTGRAYRQQVFCTTSRQLAIDVERLALSLGKPVRVSTYADKRETHYLDVHEVRLLCDRYRQAQPRHSPYFTEAYAGMVYCATVPGGLMYVRRHGAIGHWSGNSGHAGVDVRATLLAHRDDKGNLYTVVHDVKTGQEAYLRAGDLHKYVVAFPHEKRTGKVMAFVNGEVQSVDASKVTHQMLHVSHQYSPATALVPMIHNIQGNRAIMGSKMGTQALPLVEREAPYVQVRSHVGPDVSFETVFGHMVVPVSPVKGTIEKIKDGFIYVRPHGMKPGEKTSAFEDYVAASIDPDSADFEKVAASDAGLVKVPYQQHFPFPSKTYLHHTLDVKPGDKVEEGQRLGDSNYTRNGTLALGKNLSVAYMPYYGLNSNDAVVISEGAAKKLTSEHMYREVFPLHSKLTLSKAKHAAYYGSKVTPSQYAKLDETGVIKVGSKVDPKDPLVLGLVKTEIQGADLMLGKISKALVKPFKEVSLLWEHGSPGKVIDVVRTGTQIAILVKTLESMNVGDKLCYDEATDVLTASGWKPFHDVKMDDAIATLSAGKVEFAKPLAYHTYATGGRMCSVQTPEVDLVVTAHHNMWACRQDSSFEWQLIEAQALAGSACAWFFNTGFEEVHPVSVSPKDMVFTENYVGPVYCLTVPSGIMYVRRNGKAVWSGNSGRYGNKGVVSKIIPDHEMVQDEAGRPIDVLLTSAGVISRTNPAQVIETAVGKVVEKTGKPIIYDNGAHQNAEQWAHDLLKQHGIKDKETLFDPVTKREIRGGDGKGVMVGRQYIYKLFKSTDTNFSGHGVGPYDGNEQPLKTGGDESAKGIGKMELDALIAHNARNILRENAAIKSQKNDEFWKAVQLGTPLPTPKTTFAFNKFTAMLEGAGIKVDKRDSKIKLLPMTDRDILARSRGVIENKKTLIAKNLKAEKGGLFDMPKTGGPQGTLYSHIELHEPIPNPVFVEPIRRLLGLTEKQFTEKLEQHGGSWFRDQLAGTVNVDAKLSVLEGQLKTSKGADLDNVVKQIKYLRALKDEKLKPQDAYILTKVPVIPPVFRPVLPDIHNPSEVSIGDANKLYGHLMDANHVLKTTAMPSDLPKHRGMVFNAVGAVFGTHTAMDEKLQKQEVKGYLQNIAGVGTPKGGFFQRKLMRRTQDVSGRGTAVPDPNLGMDEVGIPEQMLWQMFDKLVVARLVRQGYGALAAREMVDKKAPVAREALLAESKSRPVIINRAPTLHRWSIIAAYPKLVTGKTLRVSPFIEKGMNLDFDGDTLQVHAPVQLGAIEDAKKMTLSHLLMSDQQHNKILAFPQHEAIIGVTLATNTSPGGGPVHKFNTVEEAKAAWRSGKLKLSDTVEIATVKKAEADDLPRLDSENLPGLTTDEALSYYPVESVLGNDEEPELDS